MRNKFAKREYIEDEDLFNEDPSRWLDEDLDRDSMDLEEWGFMQGYYGEM